MKKTFAGVLTNTMLLYIASVTGVGFSSGQEVYQFFVRYGAIGGISVLILPFLCTFLIFAFLYTAKKLGTNAYEKAVVAFSCRPLIWLSDALITFFVAAVVVAMIASFGAILRQLFGLHPAIGSLLGAALITVSVISGGAGTVVRFLRVAVPVVAVCACVCSIASFFIPPAAQNYVPIHESAPGAFTSGILYCSYNMMVVLGVLAPTAEKLEKKRHMFFCAAVPSFLFALLLGLEYFAIFRHIPVSCSSELPMPQIGGMLSPVVFYLYQILILVSAYGTALSCFGGTLVRVHRMKFSSKFRSWAVTVFLGAVFWLASLLGFVNIISCVYPVIGVLGTLLMVSLTVSFIRCTRLPRNTTLSTDKAEKCGHI